MIIAKYKYCSEQTIMAQTKKNFEEEIAECILGTADALATALEGINIDKYLFQDAENQIQTHQSSGETNNLQPKTCIFSKIPNSLVIEEGLEVKIANLKLTYFSNKRRDELFKRHRKEQEQKMIICKKKLQKQIEVKGPQARLTRNEFILTNQQSLKNETFPIKNEDMQKLRPDTDLNDTIVGNYIKMFNFVFLPQHLQEKCHFYSSFFMQKLICEFGKEDPANQKDNGSLGIAIREKVAETYKNIKRWTRKVDIFQKEIVVFPINAFRHWFTIILHKPYNLFAEKQSQKLELVYCDSMFEKKEFIVGAIRKYLELQLQEKRGIKMQLNETNAPCYQLLLPRQTNTHDCGLYMISYIEELLSNKKNLQNLSVIKNRRKLNLFPRTLIYTMRERLRRLFTKLINANDSQEKNNILAEYKGEKQQIMMDADPDDYDSIDEKEYRKYEKMNLAHMAGINEEQKAFMCQIKFSLDPEVNFYQR